MNTTTRKTPEILLLQPWIEDFYATDCRRLPLGLAYLAGSIKTSLPGSTVFIYDFFSPTKRQTIPLPKEFSYLTRYYGASEKSYSALFHQYYRFGLNRDSILEILTRHSPFLVGISSLFSPYYRESLALAALSKKAFPKTPVVIGGNHASLRPVTLLFDENIDSISNYSCDYVIRGEGEESIVALIKALQSGIPPESVPNIVSRSNCRTAPKQPLKSINRDALPLPDYCNLKLSDYTFNQKPMSFLITSRSCPHHCTFCSIHAVFGTKYTTRSNDDILAEICFFYRQGIRHFDIEDDNFSFNQNKCAELLDALIRLNLPDLSFSAMNGLSYHTLTPSLLKKMRAAGFSDLNLSLVSSQKHLRNQTRRPRHGEKLTTVLAHAHDFGFHSVVYFIIGLPGQSLEDAVTTLCCLAGHNCLLGPSPFYLTPNTPIAHEYKHSDFLKCASTAKDPCFSARLTALDVEQEGFNRDELYTVFRLTRVLNHLKALIDKGLTPEQEPLRQTLSSLACGQWETTIASGSPPPFAPTVLPLLKKHLTSLCGYKKNRSFTVMLSDYQQTSNLRQDR